VIPVHRALRERGQVELSVSPYYHPILPLLVDVHALSRARPDLPLPREPFAAPEDARRQLERAIERHRQVFGAPPAGAWPSEGSVSPEVAGIAASLGLSWLASDEAVLRRSFDREAPAGAAYVPWRLPTPSGPIALFFRDHDLSDRIGFVYQRWDPREAVADFLERLRKIGSEHGGEAPAVVSVMLDGENCWEAYPEDGGPFLDALYDALEQATDIRTATPADVLARRSELPQLDRLHSGSWIDADFHIWAGHPEKNRAWDLLSRARAMLVARPGANPAAWEALMRAEGSDWFWWFGDDHYTPEKPVFDALFRGHLSSIYESCGEPVPNALGVPVAAPAVAPGSRREPVAYLQPAIDGRQTHFYEWQAAGKWTFSGSGGAMHAVAVSVRDLYFGFDLERLLLRLDFVAPQAPGRTLRIEVLEPLERRVEVESLSEGAPAVTRVEADGTRIPIAGATCRVGEVLELAIPLATLGIRSGDSVQMLIQIVEGGGPIESLPPGDALRLQAPDQSFDVTVWYP
jgi:alpha-amylase/alpha-mannosidase (GH57 family)